MRRILVVSLLLGFSVALSARAADKGTGKPLTAEQQESRNSIVQKYDINQDGILDKMEIKKLSKEDKKTLARTGGVGTAKKSSVRTTKKAADSEDSMKSEKAGKVEKTDKVIKERPAERPKPVESKVKGGGKK